MLHTNYVQPQSKSTDERKSPEPIVSTVSPAGNPDAKPVSLPGSVATVASPPAMSVSPATPPAVSPVPRPAVASAPAQPHFNAPAPATNPPQAQIQIVQKGGGASAEGMPRVVVFIAIGAALIIAVWIFADVNPFVLLSSIWSGAMILLSRLGGFFRGDKTGIADLQDRLDEVRERERELIEVLKEDRAMFRERLNRLEGQGQILDEQIESKRTELRKFDTFETWEEEVWDNLTPEEQQAQVEISHGQTLTLDAIRYQYDDM